MITNNIELLLNAKIKGITVNGNEVQIYLSLKEYPYAGVLHIFIESKCNPEKEDCMGYYLEI